MSGRYRTGSSNSQQWQQIIAFVMILAIMGLLFYRVLLQHIFTMCFVLSLVSFVAMYYDKHQSRNSGYRVSESMLLMINVLGGWPGGLLGMTVLRHKRRKTTFIFMFVASVFINIYFMNRAFRFIPGWTI